MITEIIVVTLLSTVRQYSLCTLTEGILQESCISSAVKTTLFYLVYLPHKDVAAHFP